MSEISRRNILKTGAAWAIAPALLARTGFAQTQPATQPADPYADGVLVDGRPPAPSPGSFTLAVLPDTQHYSEKYPQTFLAQTKWIAEHRDSHRIAAVLHLGDITNHSASAEWDNAVSAMSLLDGKVPYFMVTGNHDYGENGHGTDRSTLFSERFPVAKFRKTPTFGGNYDKEPERMENSFHLFSAAGREFLVLALEFGPRNDVVRWANEVVAGHKRREAILITHAYLYHDNTRYDYKKYPTQQKWSPHFAALAKKSNHDMADGEALWTGLVSRHENFIMTVNGHVLADGLGRLASATPKGRMVHQILVNFQMRPNGGDGWLRLMEFKPDGLTVQVRDYSPTRKQLNQSAQNQFEIKLSAVSA